MDDIFAKNWGYVVFSPPERLHATNARIGFAECREQADLFTIKEKLESKTHLFAVQVDVSLIRHTFHSGLLFER